MKHMFPPRKILVPTDLGPASSSALQFVRVWQSRFPGAIHVLHAQHLELPPYFSGGQIQSLKQELKKAASTAAAFLKRESAAVLGFEPEASVVAGPPVEAILKAASDLQADLIVMGTHGRRGADRFWLGSVAERVVRESRIPILTVRSGTASGSIRQVMCPVGDSEVGRDALRYAAAMAHAGNVGLVVLHAVEEGAEPPDCSLVPDDVRERCQIRELTYHGDAAGAILTAVDEITPDIVVMGTEPKGSKLGGLFSTTTERVLRWSVKPLLMIPKPPEIEGDRDR